MKRKRENTINGDAGASSSSTPTGIGSSRYEVFLSFRGPDTRKTIADHLYLKIKDAGIETFRDDEELRVGKEIRSDLLQAIEDSTISIPIISKGYASSKWCLIELTHMLKCRKSTGRPEVYPIFYGVTPWDCKHHDKGCFAEAFVQHSKSKDFHEGAVQEWKDALNEVTKLKGWEKDKVAGGHEGELVKKIVNEVGKMLKKGNVSLSGDLVGMDHHMEEMTKLLKVNSDKEVRIVGIVGMGGIGKTTIAMYVYNQLCDHFEHQYCKFLKEVRENVKSKGYDKLQKKLIAIRHQKVLIVLDDVEEESQLQKIIGSLKYFDSGSRIIVTTRYSEVFKKFEGAPIYKPEGMNDEDSLLLFCKHAFKSTQPREGYEEISREIVETAAGLPLSLVVIGSMLFRKKERKGWEATLEKLKNIPAHDVQARLRISYDALKIDGQKQMFLDIACHFIGEDITYPIYMWEGCKFYPEGGEGLDVLVSLSLITIEKSTRILGYTGLEQEIEIFRMHDHLRDLGRHIAVSEEGRNRLCLWSHQEAVDTLRNQSGTENVQTLYINHDWVRDSLLNDDFKGMPNLRYLHLVGPNLEGDFDRLFSQLLWFRWFPPYSHWVHASFLGRALHNHDHHSTRLCLNKLIILDLSVSHIWDNWESRILDKPLTNLKVLNLSGCYWLTKTPDFSAFSNLERLLIAGCYNLTEIGSSVKHLKRLTFLDARRCWRLTKLPDSIGYLTQLKSIPLRNCRSLKQIPESFWQLKSLVKLDLSHSGIKKLSWEGVGKLGKLQELNCSECRKLEGAVLPNGVWSLSSLRVLNLFETNVTGAIPKDISGMSHLETLFIGQRMNLQLPADETFKLPPSITELGIPFTEASLDVVRSFVNLTKLHFYRNEPSVLVREDINRNPSRDDMSSLSNLEELELEGFDDDMMSRLVMTFGSSSRLRYLDISKFKGVVLRTGLLDLSKCKMLEILLIRDCKEMREIEGFGNRSLGSTWEFIIIDHCDSLEVLPDLSSMTTLKRLNIWYCPMIREINGLVKVLTSLWLLDIYKCPLLEKDQLHPDLLNSQSLLFNIRY